MKTNERKSTSIVKKIITILISIIILTIQLFIYFLIFVYLEKNQIFYFVVQGIGIVTVIYLYNKDINISYKLTWFFIILVFPFAGTMFYLLFGNGRRIPKRKSRRIENFLMTQIDDDLELLEEIKKRDIIGYRMMKSIIENSYFVPYANSNSTFFPDALDKHMELINDLKKAKTYIFLEFFIVSDGALMDEVTSILEEKGLEGVEIKFIYDDVGGKGVFSNKLKKRLNSIPNLELVSYEPLGININPAINYRDHRKIVVIDGKIAYVGGDNLADEYIHKKIKYGFWRDNAIKIEGDAVYNFILLFAQMWYMSTKETLFVKDYLCKHEIKNHESYILPFGDGPTNYDNPGYELFCSMISNAQSYLYLSTPYFIIDKNFIDLISKAVKSGVEVKLLIPGVADKKIVLNMTRGHLGKILKSGAKVYQYKEGFNHAKNIICDDSYAFIGTINMDYRSLFLHFECGAFLLNDPSIFKMKEDYLEAISKSTEITYKDWKNRSVFSKILEFILTLTAPMI